MRKLLISLGFFFVSIGLLMIWLISRPDSLPWVSRSHWPGLGALVGLIAGPSLLVRGLNSRSSNREKLRARKKSEEPEFVFDR